MNRYQISLSIAILFHLIIFLLFFLLGRFEPIPKKVAPPQEKRIKISTKILKKESKKSASTPRKSSFIPPPMIKGEQLKAIKKTKVKSKSKVVKKPKKKPKLKASTKPKPKPKVKPKVTKKLAKVDLNVTKPKKQIEEKKKRSSLYSFLSQDKSHLEPKKKSLKPSNIGSVSNDIKKLYGSKFGTLTKGQQKYILDNQEVMRRMTQSVLTRVASINIRDNFNVNVKNVIEFYLHPNGDMSDFRFLHKSGYYVLDDTTRETISYAYSKYPLPDEIVLIRYDVYYNLAY